ncbi:T9SS type A sorting domain-containing protein, partial [Flavobacterium sp.]|uniref:T9SS type A sorting domain-containing protein n=1 Tax=Flavobacterium sp. TaxID=239 RepID=UPI0025C06F3D
YLLEQLRCANNLITSLDVSGFNLLYDLDCSSNQINYLNVTGCHQMYTFSCGGNQLTTLDVSDCYQLFQFECTYNDIQYLNLKNGNNQSSFYYYFNNNPIMYVCANENDVNSIRSYMDDFNISGHVNSYCSFVPGGEFFTIQGNSKLDLSSNGCDENDINFPNMKFSITNGTISGSIISNTSGDYSIPVQAGSHTLTPVFENPTYFNVSPANFAVTFPAQTSPFTQNFCITSNGTHQDVEVVIVPLNVAIPGFDTSYKLVYKNKGNTTVSGSISFTFMDNVMDFVSSNPIQSMVEPNILNWNYSNLQPFETREIEVVFNLNSPQETPALNGGEILEFIAIIDPLSGDSMPSDNASTLNQEVDNSFDPNDKTCLEGSVVSTELIGQYVHYVIRFENTGTFFAQNVVVKDEIDLSKFDLNSLIVLSASHQQWTRINDNKVEFIFENIELPFPPSEERYGYIAFKIKLKNNLAVGDTFSNFASIYFDYNFPIITEPATTAIEALSNPDFEFSSFVKLYPNPASSVVTIESQTINLKSVEIFNSLGQLLQAIPNENNQLNIDVSSLLTGTYFVKVHSDKGVGISKFVKQ